MSETPNKITTLDDIPGMTPDRKAAAEAAYRGHRGTISIPASEFKGDPSRVPGHPSNPATGAMEAAAAYYDKIDAQRAAADGAQALKAAANPDLIDGVPFDVPSREQLHQPVPQPIITEMPKFDQHQ